MKTEIRQGKRLNLTRRLRQGGRGVVSMLACLLVLVTSIYRDPVASVFFCKRELLLSVKDRNDELKGGGVTGENLLVTLSNI